MNEAIDTVIFFLLGLFCLWLALLALHMGPDGLRDGPARGGSWWWRLKTCELDLTIGWLISLAIIAAMSIGFFQTAFR